MWRFGLGLNKLSGGYDKLCRENPGQIIVRALDPHYHSLTFVRAGEFAIGGGATAVQGTERVVSALAAVQPAANAA